MDSYDKLKPDDIPWMVVLIVLVVWMETYRTSNQHSPRCCTCYWEQLEKVYRRLSFGHKSEVWILTYAHYFSFYLRSSHDLLFLLKMVSRCWLWWSHLLVLSLLLLLFQLAQRWPSIELVWMRRCFLHNLSKVMLLMNYTVFTHQKRNNVFVIKTKSEVQLNRFIHTRHFGGQKQEGKCAVYCLEWKPLILFSLSEFWLLKVHDLKKSSFQLYSQNVFSQIGNSIEDQ